MIILTFAATCNGRRGVARQPLHRRNFLFYFALAAFGASAADVAGFVAETGCVVAGFFAFFLDFLVVDVVLVDALVASALASALTAVGAAAGAATGALAGAVVAGAVVCAAAVSDAANAPAISALNNLVMSNSSV
jgi:hypothetical protein